jgi:hypothetical protein
MFNHDLYDEQRKKFNAISAFPEVYDKIRPEKGIADLTDLHENELRLETKKNHFAQG